MLLHCRWHCNNYSYHKQQTFLCSGGVEYTKRLPSIAVFSVTLNQFALAAPTKETWKSNQLSRSHTEYHLNPQRGGRPIFHSVPRFFFFKISGKMASKCPIFQKTCAAPFPAAKTQHESRRIGNFLNMSAECLIICRLLQINRKITLYSKYQQVLEMIEIYIFSAKFRPLSKKDGIGILQSVTGRPKTGAFVLNCLLSDKTGIFCWFSIFS